MSRRHSLPRKLTSLSVFTLLSVLGSILMLTVPAGAQAASVSHSCFKDNGRFDVALSVPVGAPAATFELRLTGLPPRTRTLQSGQSRNVTYTGRNDGAYTLDVYASGSLIERYTAMVSCDPEAAVKVDCFDGNGRIAVTLVNTRDRAVTYVSSVSGLSNLTRVVASGETARAVRTGRPDDTYLVRVKRNGTVIVSQNVSVNCDAEAAVAAPPVDVTTATVSCAAGKGRFDVTIVFVSGSLEPNAVFFELKTGKITPRTAVLTQGSRYSQTITGRNNGEHDIVVRANGAVYFSERVTVAC